VSCKPFVASAVAALVISQNKLLLGKRFENGIFKGWQCPGGYLNTGETIENSALRICETKAGITIFNSYSGPYSNNIFPSGKHTTTLYVISKEYTVQSAQIFENPQTQWRWFDPQNLPETLFLPLLQLQQQYNLTTL